MKTSLLTKLKNLRHSLSKQQLWFLGTIAFFLLLNCVSIYKEMPLIPLLTVGAVFLYLIVYHVDWTMYLMALSTPFSIIVRNQNIHLGLSLPAEPLMIMMTLLFIFHILYDWKISRQFVLHPVSIVIFIYLLWMLITSITSEIPVVSFKFLASKIWFITSCYWMVIQLFKDNYRCAIRYFNCYAVALAVVVLITTYKHALSGFAAHYAHWVMSPFYNDHTAYGAVLAFFLPIVTCFFFLPENSKNQKIFYAILICIFLIGFYLSFSRAAWISLVLAVGVWIVLKLRIKFSWLVAGVAIVGSLLYFYSDDILYKMSKNSQDSSGNFVEHLQSMSNISTDASNVERLNRWNSAFGMIKERPITGWGPGTYQFVYAPFQRSQYKTIITTDFGDGGNAHSEYIGPCAESGFPGLLTVLALVITSLYVGLTTYNHIQDPTRRLLCLAMVLALITYFIHGCLNNFLDTDKLSLPFWGAFAMITMLSAEHKLNFESKTL